MSVKNKVKRCNKEIKRLQDELEIYKLSNQKLREKLDNQYEPMYNSYIRAYYNQIKKTKNMTIEEAENIIDDMCQDKYKLIEKRTEDCLEINLSKLDDVKFTYLEFASLRILRELKNLRCIVERYKKEIEERAKRIFYLENNAKKEIEEEINNVKVNLYKNYIPRDRLKESIEELLGE